MNKPIIAGLALAVSLAAAPASQALPLIDFGAGAGALTLEDDDKAAIAANLVINVDIPATPFSVEGSYAHTLSDGEFDVMTPQGPATVDYSGNMLSAFLVGETPTPAVRVRGKLGLSRTDFDFSAPSASTFMDSSDSSTDFAFGVGLSVRNWHFEWTRTKLDDFDTDLDYLSATLTF